jgi:putative DNA primase/helicase
MKRSRRELVKLLGGEVCDRWINIRGPGHSKGDRSLGVLFDRSAPDGFRVNNFAGDDPNVCRAYVKEQLQKKTGNGSICLSLEDEPAPHKNAQAHAGALRIWDEAEPIADTPASTYLGSRKCTPYVGELWPSDLRFHHACPYASFKVPALIALMRNPITGHAGGIQRTPLKDDGSGKRKMPDGFPAKMMLGPSKSAAVMLFPAGLELGIAEGVETAMSARQIFKMPVWAAMSAGGIRDFPVIYGIRRLTVFADNDRVGLDAAYECTRRYAKAGVESEVRHPPLLGSDWNDYLQKEESHAKETYKEE